MKKDIAEYRKLINQFSKTSVLVIGDLMVDRFVRGKVTRISPEAPVPVVQVKDEVNMPGGSGNVVLNLASLGCAVNCCGVIGEDSAGEELIERFLQLGVKTDKIKKDAIRSTTIKTRVIAEHQQVVRFDKEDQRNIPHALQKEIEDSLPQMIQNVNAIILSDYGKGMITKSLLSHAIFYAKKFKKPICVDPKLEHFRSYKNVTCITPNLSEAMGGMHKIRLDGENGFHELGKEILKELNCQSVLITQGEEGMTLFEKTQEATPLRVQAAEHSRALVQITHIPAKAQEVYDVTGAGDTVISVLTLCLACGASLVQAATLANLAAGIVVGKLGTATAIPSELKDALNFL